ncbi:hypothetical protein GGX14DRAFT_419606 [Mycena pura]|uniref:Uncharacterized protein n=1 Tax=Mycena pura TaxID=153505 RepID=A0AAD7E441_9AGAR|nr:hypothetical protein GGX14DRAFT_419606 [Mycena pura]
MQMAPHARVIITHDDDWGLVFQPNGNQPTFQNSSELVRQIAEKFTITEEDGLVFFAPEAERVTSVASSTSSIQLPPALKDRPMQVMGWLPNKYHGGSLAQISVLTRNSNDDPYTPNREELTFSIPTWAGFPSVDSELAEFELPDFKSLDPAKRGRGRPKGSKNKKSPSHPATTGTTLTVRGRGRPPKEKKDDESMVQSIGEDNPVAKRKRGRPPIAPIMTHEEEPSPKRKRGRSPKSVAPVDPAAEPKKRGRPPKKAPDGSPASE